MKSPNEYELPPNVFTHVASMNHNRTRNLATGGRQSSSKSPRKVAPSLSVYQHLTFNKPSDFYRQRSKDEVVDGYLIDDPEVLKMELHDAHKIIEVTRIKLLQYLSVFRKHFPENRTDELYQSLDGIEELCALLNMKRIEVKEDDIPVDQAFEPDDNDTLRGKMFEPRPFPINFSTSNIATAKSKTNSEQSHRNRVITNIPPVLKRNSKEIEMNLIRSSQIGWSELCSYPPTSIPFETEEIENGKIAVESVENKKDEED